MLTCSLMTGCFVFNIYGPFLKYFSFKLTGSPKSSIKGNSIILYQENPVKQHQPFIGEDSMFKQADFVVVVGFLKIHRNKLSSLLWKFTPENLQKVSEFIGFGIILTKQKWPRLYKVKSQISYTLVVQCIQVNYLTDP